MSTVLDFHVWTLDKTVRAVLDSIGTREDTEFTYTLENFFHPFVGDLIQQLNRHSLAGFFDPEFHSGLATPFFDAFYTALTSELVKLKAFDKEIDLRVGGPYANYNWELLFHVPLTIAVHLSKNQRFAEAQRWFHYIFDPTANDRSIPVPQRYWKFLAFRQASEVKQIDEQLALLSKPPDECSPEELEQKKTILQGYEASRNKPFQPHAVARARQLAYQYNVVMKYLDNLIAWGDSLFAQDTIESINEATQHYVLAANLLGERPQRIPPTGAVRPRTFAELRKKGLDPASNSLVPLEGKFPLSLGLPKTNGATAPSGESGPLFGIGRTLYFCIPRNEKMLGYWDTVADRLFKIRHCMNIEGVVRQLALFDPPIDPMLLVKAAAAGLDIGSVVNGLNQPVSPVRAPFLIQKALEICAEVRGFGNALQVAIEKGEGERLSLLRQSHEISIQRLQQEIRHLQWKQSQEAARSLLVNRRSALERLRHYQRLLGVAAEPNAPDDLPLTFATQDDAEPTLTAANFDVVYGALVGQYAKPLTLQKLPPLAPAGGASPAQQSGAEGQGALHLNANESSELNVHSPDAQEARDWAARLDMTASNLASIPGFSIKFHFWGLGGAVDMPLGTILSNAARAVGSHFANQALSEDRDGQNAAKTGTYERRTDEWVLQYNLAAHELMQMGRQILTALIAEQLAHHEYRSVTRQIANAQDVDSFLREKFSNEELYAWMQGELSRLYYDAYRFAFDTARKAERAMKNELMRKEVTDTDYLKFNYWDGGRKGLLSGEALYLDLKRMELAYHEHNRREYELAKHVSLRQLNPAALLELRATGSCEVTIPEWVFDLDTPGHYLRRIKSVALTIPCVTGPYTGVNCTLTLTKSTLRTSPSLDDGYNRQGSEDERFIDYFGATQSIVTSSGQNDSGLFETNLRDGQLLPFEGAGVESSWRLELPATFRQFDYDTLSDVIFHFRLTARPGGVPLRDAAVESIPALIAEARGARLGLLIGLRSDFPTEWSAFDQGDGDFAATISKDYFPYLAQRQTITITGFDLYDVLEGAAPTKLSVGDAAMQAEATSALADEAEFPLSIQTDQLEPMENPWLVIGYQLE
jgi:hypothetical protein